MINIGFSDTVSFYNCQEPLGMYSGAIGKSEISCDSQHTDSGEPNCGDCKDARYQVDQLPHSQYWCIDFSQTTTATLDVNFMYITYISKMKIENIDGHANCKYVAVHIAYTFGQFIPSKKVTRDFSYNNPKITKVQIMAKL